MPRNTTKPTENVLKAIFAESSHRVTHLFLIDALNYRYMQ